MKYIRPILLLALASATLLWAVAGTMVTVPGIVTEAADKKALWEERGGPQPAVIDMESMTWAAVASERGLPYLVAEIGGEIDLALLPVWGWGPKLGSGHMDPAQAAAALRLLRARRAVPIHWGTYTPAGAPRIWPWMTETPAAQFAEQAGVLCPGAEVNVLAPGESIAAVR